jgi:hypothetical protein
MDSGSIATAIAIVALILAGMMGRTGVLISRSGFTHEVGQFFLILAAWLATVVWTCRAWPWYWVPVAIVVIAFASGPVVSLRTFGLWLQLRWFVAIATSASAALLWFAFPPGG